MLSHVSSLWEFFSGRKQLAFSCQLSQLPTDPGNRQLLGHVLSELAWIWHEQEWVSCGHARNRGQNKRNGIECRKVKSQTSLSLNHHIWLCCAFSLGPWLGQIQWSWQVHKELSQAKHREVPFKVTASSREVAVQVKTSTSIQGLLQLPVSFLTSCCSEHALHGWSFHVWYGEEIPQEAQAGLAAWWLWWPFSGTQACRDGEAHSAFAGLRCTCCSKQMPLGWTFTVRTRTTSVIPGSVKSCLPGAAFKEVAQAGTNVS